MVEHIISTHTHTLHMIREILKGINKYRREPSDDLKRMFTTTHVYAFVLVLQSFELNANAVISRKRIGFCMLLQCLRLALAM